MAGASIETTLELWAASLRDVKARMRGLFTQDGVDGSRPTASRCQDVVAIEASTQGGAIHYGDYHNRR